MAVSRPDAFDRAFPRREILQGVALRSVVWSAVASVLLCGVLLTLTATLDLLIHRGTLEVAAEEVEAARKASGHELRAGINRNLGLFPTVWRLQQQVPGIAAADLYRMVTALQGRQSALFILIALALLLGTAQLLTLARGSRLASRAAVNTVTRLRQHLHRQALRLGPGELSDEGATASVRLFTTDMDVLQEGIGHWIVRLGRYPLLVLLLVLLALAVDVQLALLCLIPLLACWLFLQRQQRKYDAVQEQALARARTEQKLLADGMCKTRLVRGYGLEEFEHAQFQRHLERFRVSSGQVERARRVARAFARFLVLFVVAVAILLISLRILADHETLSVAAGGLLLASFACMWRPLNSLARLMIDRRPASLAADRVFRYLDRIPEVGQAVGAKFLNPLSSEISFEDVVAELPDHRRLLDGLSLKVPAGEVTAIVSLDDLEPRALASLLPRFLEPQSGRVLFDGNDVAWVTLESLRAETVWVGGADPFFTGTVKENISCGSPSYSMQDVTDAARKVHAHKFVLKLSQGYETVLGEHGESLDAGRAFQIGLARAILRDPALMIIEEPRESLDEDTKQLLDDAWSRIVENRTVIVLPSRLSTVRRADRVVVLHQGRIEDVGRYSELVKRSTVYRHWEYVRFNEFRSHDEPGRQSGN